MRFLIVSAVLACAAAAPSFPQVPYPGLPILTPVVYSAALPTISAGDIQAAVIDAQVKVQDLAIAQVDQARSILEQNLEDVKEKVVTDSDQFKENTVEAFWSAQEKQWQALDALKTAEAVADGDLASNPVSDVTASVSIKTSSPAEPKAEEKKEMKSEESSKDDSEEKSAEPSKDSELKSVEPTEDSEVKSAEPSKDSEVKSAEPSKDSEVKSAEPSKDEQSADSEKKEVDVTKSVEVKTGLEIQPYSYQVVNPFSVSPLLRYDGYSFPTFPYAPIVRSFW